MQHNKQSWKPVLKPLSFGDYDPVYGDVGIRVCVNPDPEFLLEFKRILVDFHRIYEETAALNDAVKAAPAGKERQAKIAAGRKAVEFFEYLKEKHFPALHAWFARLWSYGPKKFPPENVAAIQKEDPGLLNWLESKSIDMVLASPQDRQLGFGLILQTVAPTIQTEW